MIRLRRMVSKKIAYVNSSDQELRHLPMVSMKVHGVASEQRADRVIIGLDITGACSYAVAHAMIPDPKLIAHKKGVNCHVDDPAWSGFYLIEALSSKFKYTPPIPVRSVQGFLVSTQASYPFKMWIHHSEWGIWSTLFDCVVLEGYEAPALKHPLCRVAAKVQQQREAWADTYSKALASSMHTCMGSKWSEDDRSIVRAIWSLHHMPMAWVRGEWLRQWHRTILAYPSALLCYANVDSMHWSISKKEYYQNPYVSSNEWGQWRKLFEGNHGVWLAIGKYWIAQDRALIHYQNAGSSSGWRTKIRHRVDTKKYPGYRPWYSACVWHGLASPTILVRKEKGLVQHILPTFESVQSETSMHTLLLRSVAKDRLWKKKLWFLLKRDCNEKTQTS